MSTDEGSNMRLLTQRRADPRGREIVEDAWREMPSPARRAFLKRGLTLGGLSLLTGCAITDAESVQKVLTAVSRFNDRAQAGIFDPARLAPTYPETMITRVNVNGEPGYFVTGGTHFLYLASDGVIREEPVRLGRNVMLWQHGPLTLRLEGDFSLARALRIARSFR